MVTEESELISDFIKDAIGNEDVIIQYADNSLNELKTLQHNFENTYEELYAEKESINTYSVDDTNVLDDLVGLYVDELSNELVVQITDITDEKIAEIKVLFGEDDSIRYEEGYQFTYVTEEWRPGRAIYKATGTGRSSTGYRAYYIDSNGTRYNGFTTAGHSYSVGESAYAAAVGVDTLGPCLVSQYGGGNNDVAFIAMTNSWYEVSNTMNYSDANGSTTGGATIAATTYPTDIVAWTPIFKVGCKSYLTTGYVLSDEYTMTFDGHTITNMIMSETLVSLKGDSGGCVYAYIDGQHVAVGTMSGITYNDSNADGEITADEVTASFSSQIKYAVSDLGIRKY